MARLTQAQLPSRCRYASFLHQSIWKRPAHSSGDGTVGGVLGKQQQRGLEFAAREGNLITWRRKFQMATSGLVKSVWMGLIR